MIGRRGNDREGNDRGYRREPSKAKGRSRACGIARRRDVGVERVERRGCLYPAEACFAIRLVEIDC